MRIGLIAPPWVPVPPPAYGGTETVIDCLARSLTEHGHAVELFTVGGSTCPVGTRCLYDAPYEPMGFGPGEAAHVLAAYDSMRAAGVDVVHDHTTLGALIAGRTAAGGPPIVTTNHGPFDAVTRQILQVAATYTRIVAISHSHGRSAGAVPVDAVVPHGIDLDVYRPLGRPQGYLAFVGRMAAEKGVHHAIEVARRAGRPLRIVAKMRSAEEKWYYREMVQPLLGPDDEEPQELPLHERIAVLQGADALLNPIGWEEPFGLVMAEALACGVPVIAFPRGAAPEIVETGRTGFLCRDTDEMIAAIDRLPEIDRTDCRAQAVLRFGRDRMARDYETVYQRAIVSRREERGLLRWLPTLPAPVSALRRAIG